MTELNIVHNKEENQFFVLHEGKKSTLDYQKSDDGKTLDYLSTFVPNELRGSGIGEKLVIYALNYAKDHHFNIIPSCPFVQTIVKRHPEFQKLIKREV